MDLKKLKECLIPFDQFSLHWRFDNESYKKLSQIYLDQVKPFTSKASAFLWQYSSKIAMDLVSRQNFHHFSEISTEAETLKKWLFYIGLAFQKDVYIVWQPDIAAVTKWKIFVEYFDDFYYFPDEILIFDNSLNWGLLIQGEKVIFGSNIYD